jgi:alanyl-tRNA synthetase
MTSANEIRRSFLAFFERHGHRVAPSSPLVPHDDPTLLFTNAGMNQFKDLFLGRETRDYRRAATAQKCMRVSGKHNDLDNVGPSLRHHTFFEMLGNFSFGDYFKREAIPFAWALLTEEWRIPPDRLYATVFKGEPGIPRDAEAYDMWAKFLPGGRIGELGLADNFWQMGDTGPCGRCSEIYYYRGPEIGCSEEGTKTGCRGLECSCDRYVEIWNNVFMEFDRQADGTLQPLPAPSIDTGMGLERITAVLQGHLSNYDTDLFTPLLAAIAARTGTQHRGTMEPSDVSMRVVADHMRAMTFLIADGVVPSNEWRGYVLRKIMRRAMRHGMRLGMTEPFLYTLVDTLVREFGDAYPELKSGRDAIVRVVRSEEERFDAVLAGGLPRLEEVLDRAAAAGVVPGDAAFRLYDTYGLPRDFIEDMIDERKLTLDREGFERAMEAQRDKARAKSKFGGAGVGEAVAWQTRPEVAGQQDVFRGYEATNLKTQIVELLDADRRPVDQLRTGEHGFAALSQTPFYLQSGGQVSDVGRLSGPRGEAVVTDVVKGPPDVLRFHAVTIEHGSLAYRDLVTADVDVAARDATRRNHTATHLLHAALRQVLGGHVKQAGSLVAPDRLRFDFTHFGPLTPEQIIEVERIVNEHVLRNTAVETEVKNTQDAIAAGAMALFGEKYGDRVRVVSVPGFSVELCGGTHVRATGDIGLFAILSESGVAAGTRRIEAMTGIESVRAYQRQRDELAGLAAALNARPGDLTARIAALQDENRKLARELQQARMKAALGGSSSGAADEVIDVAGVKVIARAVTGLDKEALRALVDKHRDRIKSGVVILATASDSKVALVVGVTPDLATKLPAGDVVKQLAPIVGGRGGGRGDLAEAGGKDPSRIALLVNIAADVVEAQQGAEGVPPIMASTAPWAPQAVSAVRRWLELRGEVTEDPETGYMIVKQPDGVATNVEVRLIYKQELAERKMRAAVDGATKRSAMPYMLVLVARVAAPALTIKPILERALESHPLSTDSVEVDIGFLEDDARFKSEGRLWPK